MKMLTKGIDIATFIEAYKNGDNKAVSLEAIMKKILLETFEEEEYKELFTIPHQTLQVLVVLKCQQNLLENFLIKSENEEVVSYISSRIKSEKIELNYSRLINAKCPKVRAMAISHLSKAQLIKRLPKEIDMENVEKMLTALGKYEISFSEAEKLLNSKNELVRIFSLDYLSTYMLIDRLISENSYHVIECILNILENSNYVPRQAELEQLLSSEDNRIKAYALKFVPVKKLVNIATSEEDMDILLKISKLLEKKKLTVGEADKLVDSKSRSIRAYAYKYASLEVVLIKINEEKEDALLKILFSRLKSGLSEAVANHFMESTNENVRIFATDFASTEKVSKTLVNENSEKVIGRCIKRLEKSGVNETQANRLLAANSPIARCYAVKYATKHKILKRLAVETDEKFILEAVRCYPLPF